MRGDKFASLESDEALYIKLLDKVKKAHERLKKARM